MKDFTLKAYGQYLSALQQQGLTFLTFRDYLTEAVPPERFCLLRHDVDRKPQNALNMAKLERAMEIPATYYFRTKPEVFDADIIRRISAMGHEIGYHYECLSDTEGDMALAHENFQRELERIRKVATIETISMHGRPLRPYDNRDMWRSGAHHAQLAEKYGLLGEIYLDIDYTDIAYINDTGRNWYSNVSNRRDKVVSEIPADFHSGAELLQYFKGRPHPKMVFQIHPERWSDDPVEWQQQRLKDQAINWVKAVMKMIGR